jgi:gliding motility-associated-like protein
LIELTVTGGPSATNGIPNNYEYSIDGGTTFITGSNPMIFANLASGFYDIVVRDLAQLHCIGVLAVDLGSNSNITAVVTTTNESCFGYADGTATVLPSSPSGSYTYEWFTSMTPTIIFSTNQTATGLAGNALDFDGDGIADSTAFTYFVRVTDGVGCVYLDSAFVIKPPSIDLTATIAQTVSCFGDDDGVAQAEVAGRDSSAVSFVWSNGSTNSYVTNLTSGMHYVTVTDAFGCTATDTVDVSQPAGALVAAMTGSTISCANYSDGVVTIDTIYGGTPPYLYSFSAIGPYGSSAILAQGLATGIYSVYIQDANGCIDTVSNLIIRDTIDYTVTAFQDQTIIMGDTVILYGAVNSTAIDSSLVTWAQLDPNTGIITTLMTGDSALIAFTPDIFYTDMQFILYLNNGCGDSSIVTIEVSQDQTVYVPNIFSPNGDGTNDIFTIYGSDDVREVKKFMVFDRWGELVHYGENFPPNSIDPTDGWNGTFNNKAMNPAVFVYYAEIELTSGEIVTRKGDVTLIK